MTTARKPGEEGRGRAQKRREGALRYARNISNNLIANLLAIPVLWFIARSIGLVQNSTVTKIVIACIGIGVINLALLLLTMLFVGSWLDRVSKRTANCVLLVATFLTLSFGPRFTDNEMSEWAKFGIGNAVCTPLAVVAYKVGHRKDSTESDPETGE